MSVMAVTSDAIDIKCLDNSRLFSDFPKSFQESINNIIKLEGYVKHRVEKKMVPQAGNFLSLLYEMDITGETADGENVTSLFIKKIVTLEKIKIGNVTDLYSRELFIYSELSKIFVMLQNAAKIPDNESFTFIKCYPSDTDSIIMENLSKKGYKTYDKTKVIPIAFIEQSIIKLAKFHALSYVLKKKMPKYFDDKIKTLNNHLQMNSDWKEFVHNLCAVTGQVLEGETKDKITNYAPRMIQTYSKFMNDIVPSNGCVCHGDYKFLNILVKEVDDEVLAVKPIDYQLVYYGCPVHDFLFFVFTSTDREFRRKNLTYLKDLYFENFAKFLSYFDVDVNTTYSRQEFENDYEERLEMGLVFGLYLAAFTYAHFEEGFDVSKLSMSELPIVPDEMFTDRVRGIVEDYIDWGYL